MKETTLSFNYLSFRYFKLVGIMSFRDYESSELRVFGIMLLSRFNHTVVNQHNIDLYGFFKYWPIVQIFWDFLNELKVFRTF
jgi:hypothetical protein